MLNSPLRMMVSSCLSTGKVYSIVMGISAASSSAVAEAVTAPAATV